MNMALTLHVLSTEHEAKIPLLLALMARSVMLFVWPIKECLGFTLGISPILTELSSRFHWLFLQNICPVLQTFMA
jgi:hypothetical protein